MIVFLFILVFNFCSFSALDAKYDEFDGFELVRVLIDDNKADLAKEEIDKINSKDNSDLHAYWSGVIAYKKDLFLQAESSFLKAQFSNDKANGVKRDLFLGRTYSALGLAQKCVERYEKSSDILEFQEKDFIAMATCLLKKKDETKAAMYFLNAFKKYKSLTALFALNEFLVSKKMFNVATEISLNWLATRSNQSSDFIAVADFLHKKDYPQGRLQVLELARIKYPLDIDINLNLNQIFYEKIMPLAVEEGFFRASLVDRKYAYHAAEMNRQVGRFERSKFFNSLIPDEKQRLKQKLAVYVDQGLFAMIASLESILQRSELINEDEVRYALAYSLVRVGEYRRPLQYLAKITNKDFLEKTVILRNALTDCVENNKVCKL